MLRIIAIFSVSILLLACRKEEESAPAVNVIEPRKEDVATIGKILNEAAARQRNIPSNQEQSRAHKEALAVFQDFWNPKTIKRYGSHEWDTELYADSKYLIVQQSLIVATRKSDDWPVNELQYTNRPYEMTKDDWVFETIEDFSPSVRIPDTIVIPLTKELSDELLGFLGGNFTEATTPDIMSPAQAREESRLKLAAACTMTRFYSKHWGDGWHLISHPEVEQILFDREYQHALVSFRIVYQGGYAFYDKTPDGWVLSKSVIDWIE